MSAKENRKRPAWEEVVTLGFHSNLISEGEVDMLGEGERLSEHAWGQVLRMWQLWERNQIWSCNAQGNELTCLA